MENKQILKNLHAVLIYAKEHFSNEFVNQEVVLSEEFKKVFGDYMKSRDKEIAFFEHTATLTNRDGQNIYIANQWFAIASYYVDFCTELLTYRQYFDKVCKRLGILTSPGRKNFAERLRTLPSESDKIRYTSSALEILEKDFPMASEHERVAGYLWRFASDYDWWSGSKTINRNDFHISPILNQLNVVNASAEFLAEIVLSYSSDLRLRRMVEHLENFTINARKNTYQPSETEQESYKEAEEIITPVQTVGFRRISISAASLERFQSTHN